MTCSVILKGDIYNYYGMLCYTNEEINCYGMFCHTKGDIKLLWHVLSYKRRY